MVMDIDIMRFKNASGDCCPDFVVQFHIVPRTNKSKESIKGKQVVTGNENHLPLRFLKLFKGRFPSKFQDIALNGGN